MQRLLLPCSYSDWMDKSKYIFHVRNAVASLAIYLINRFIIKRSIISCEYLIARILKYQLNDFLGAFLLCAYINIALLFIYKDREMISLKIYFLVGCLCCLFWEIIIPIFFKRNSTPDILDCIAYMLGCFAYWILFKTKK